MKSDKKILVNLVVDEVDLGGQKYHGITCNIGLLSSTEATIERFPLTVVPSEVGDATVGNRPRYVLLRALTERRRAVYPPSY